MAFAGSSATKRVQPRMGCAYGVTVFLAAGAVGLLVLAQRIYRQQGRADTAAVLVPAVLGLGLAVLTWVYHRFAQRIVRESQEEEVRRAQFPDKPWKWKKEWQGGAIDSGNAGTAIGLWVFALFWNAISSAAVIAMLTRGVRRPGEYFILIFPLVGAGLLWAAIYHTLRWRKYGRTRFVPSSLPGVIGGYLGGVIEVPARVLPEADARLSLKCVHRVTRGSGKNRRTTESVLWEREERIARDQWVSGAGGTRIPVLFFIPAECRGTDESDGSDQVVWRLAASAATPGVDFDTQFTVPVFVTGETAVAPEAGRPLLDEYQAQPLDAAALLACGVRREGDTFHFSASHLAGSKAVTAVLQLGIVGLLAWFWGRGIPGPVWGITLFFGALISLFTAAVWFNRYELRIETREIVVTKPRPWGTKVVCVPRADVKRIQADKAMASGESQYYRLSLVGGEGVDPAGKVQSGEPFHVRKLRYQLGQSDKGGKAPPRSEILAGLKDAPKFVVPFAGHVPGPSRADAVAAMVLEAIRGK